MSKADGLRFEEFTSAPRSYEVIYAQRTLGWVGEQHGMGWVVDCLTPECPSIIHMYGYRTRLEATEALMTEYEGKVQP